MIHHMTLVQSYPTGAQDWLCPVCGRRFVMQMQRNPIRRVILVEGDNETAHTGSTGGLQMGGVEIKRDEPGEPSETLDLSAWENGL